MNTLTSRAEAVSLVKEDRLGGIRYPVLVVSSRAGLGNDRAGRGIVERLTGGPVYHHPIEELIPEGLRKANFERYRWICFHAPFLLACIYCFPLNYAFKYHKERLLKNGRFEGLKRTIESRGIRTVVATNHRAAFWASALKMRGEVDCALWGIMTDYGMSPGWKYVFWDRIDHFIGPVTAEALPARMRAKYFESALPIAPEYAALKSRPGRPDHVLVTGGGWGLGDITSVTASLRASGGDPVVHLVCGDNGILLAEARTRFASDSRVIVHGALPSLAPLMAECGAVVTRPGAMTMTEAYEAGRQIFLVPGLPVLETSNARHGIEFFSARPFSIGAFLEWRKRAAAPS